MESPVSVWEDPQCPFRVEWVPEKLNELRIAVVDAYFAVRHGGIEIGGILLGRVEGKVLRIENFAPMECEHLTGPSFVLSPKDEAALEAQLASLGGQPVGWFHSHTRSEIHLSPQDVEIQNRFFSQPSQIAMVLRPANNQAPRANYFFRGPRGAMRGGSREFLIEPIRSKPPEPGVASTPPPPPAAETGPQELPPPALLREAKPAQARSFLWASMALMVVALAAAAFFTRELWMPK